MEQTLDQYWQASDSETPICHPANYPIFKELTSLNLDHLDVEELELRLELASALEAYPCGIQWGY